MFDMGSNADTGHGDIPTNTFAARLMLTRAHAGHLSVRDAAERCGLSHQSWLRWEREATNPRDVLAVARAVANGLGVDYMWLLHGGPLREEDQQGRHDPPPPGLRSLPAA